MRPNSKALSAPMAMTNSRITAMAIMASRLRELAVVLAEAEGQSQSPALIRAAPLSRLNRDH
jgi:hypothetical protein